MGGDEGVLACRTGSALIITVKSNKFDILSSSQKKRNCSFLSVTSRNDECNQSKTRTPFLNHSLYSAFIQVPYVGSLPLSETQGVVVGVL